MATKKKKTATKKAAEKHTKQGPFHLSMQDVEKQRENFPKAIWFDAVEIAQRQDGVATIVFYALDVYTKKMIEVTRLQTSGGQLKALEKTIGSMIGPATVDS